MNKISGVELDSGGRPGGVAGMKTLIGRAFGLALLKPHDANDGITALDSFDHCCTSPLPSFTLLPPALCETLQYHASTHFRDGTYEISCHASGLALGHVAFHISGDLQRSPRRVGCTQRVGRRQALFSASSGLPLLH